MSTRRDKLVNVKQSATTHAGLWRDKYICEQRRDDTESRRTLVAEVAELFKGFNKDDPYQQFYARWTQTLKECDARCRTATVQGRMVVGLGDESVLETSVALHRTYGVPYIPGSALKGVVARWVRERLEGSEWGQYETQGDKQVWKPKPPYITLFGDTTAAGYVTFFDALYVPGSGHKGQALWPDVITVHHPDYYQEKKQDGELAPPADWNSPTPIPFLSATGSYTIALGAPPGCEAWVERTFDLLQHALRDLGVGAKTSSGYGRLEVEGAGQQTVHTTAAQPAQAEQPTEPTPEQHFAVAEEKLGGLRDQRLMVKFVELREDGVVAQPKDPKQTSLRCFVPTAQFADRTPTIAGDDRSCIVRDLIERDGEWMLRLDWPKKDKEKKKGKKK